MTRDQLAERLDILQTGMTKRELFAMHVFQGLISQGGESYRINGDQYALDTAAVLLADALLITLQRKDHNPLANQ